jgi:hypothetical protein
MTSHGAGHAADRPTAHGLIAEFPDPAALVRAAHAVHKAGYRRVEAYAPMPVHGLVEALGARDDGLARVALIGGLIGGLGAYFLQWYGAAVDYPINVGGRTPLWPGLIPGTFEMTLLGAIFGAFFGALLRSGLPQLYHPVFNSERFAAASSDGFFLCIETGDPHFDGGKTRELLGSLQAVRIDEVGA